jgi:PIN domain nuclease of toxin-antitoxin system
MDGNVRKLTRSAKEQIEKSDLLICPMVYLELQYLYEIGKVTQPAHEVYQYLHARIGLTMCQFPMHTAIACAVAEIWTRDVFDRIIVGYAKANNEAPLITADGNILDNYRRAIW